MLPVNEVNEVKPDGPGLRCELPFAIRLLLDHLYSLANIETEQACNLAKPCETCCLIIAGFVALDLLLLHTQTHRQILLRQSRRDARLNEHLRQSFEGIQFKNLGAARPQCLVFLRRLLVFETRMQVDAFLKEHEVYDFTVEDFKQDCETLRQISGKGTQH